MYYITKPRWGGGLIGCNILKICVGTLLINGEGNRKTEKKMLIKMNKIQCIQQSQCVLKNLKLIVF